MRLQADDEVSGELVLRPGATDPRDLEMELQVDAVAGAAAGEATAGGAAPIRSTYRVSHWGP
jgi:protein arginine N-methyltransferase 1